MTFEEFKELVKKYVKIYADSDEIDGRIDGIADWMHSLKTEMHVKHKQIKGSIKKLSEDIESKERVISDRISMNERLSLNTDRSQIDVDNKIDGLDNKIDYESKLLSLRLDRFEILQDYEDNKIDGLNDQIRDLKEEIRAGLNINVEANRSSKASALKLEEKVDSLASMVESFEYEYEDEEDDDEGLTFSK